jgi:MFS family permease
MDNHVKAQGNETQIWNSIFIKVVIINMMVHLCVYMSNTLSGLFADYLGATATIVGLVTSLFALTALLFKTVSAPAIDAFNRKNILVGSILIMFVSFVGYFISKSIPMLIISRLLMGIGLAFVPTVCMTMASDSLPHEKMLTGIGYFSVGTAVCWAAGPALGLLLKGALGYNYTFGILAIFMLLTIAFAMTLKTSYKPVNKFKITFNSIVAKEALVPALVLFFLSMSFSVILSFLVLYGNLVLFNKAQVANSVMGTFFTIYAVTMIFTRPLIGKLADKFGTVKVIIPSMLCFATAVLIISFSRSLPMFLLAGFIGAFGYGGSQPAMQAVCMKSVPKERRGAASCTSYIGMDIANLVGPVIAGAIVVHLGSNVAGYTSMWQIMVFPIVIAMLVSIVFRKQITNAGKQFTSPEIIEKVVEIEIASN